MPYYAVIDTNVIVSAMLKWNSIPGSIMDLAFSDVVIPLVNDEILHEYKTVLMRKKFHLDKGIVADFLNELQSHSIMLDAEHIDIELPDPKDLVFYEVTMEARKHQDAKLVTGNIKHFTHEPFILTPRQFLDLILNNYSK